MKKMIIFCLLVFVLTNPFLLFAQTTGDYRSAGTGNWSNTATWESYNGTSWVAASTPPASTDGIVTIQNGHNVTVNTSVTIDQLVVGTGATLTKSAAGITLTITGSDNTVDGSLTLSNVPVNVNSGNLIFTSNASITATIDPAIIFDGASTLSIPSGGIGGTGRIVLINSGTTTLTSSASTVTVNGIIYIANNAGGDPTAVLSLASGKDFTFKGDIIVRPTGTINGSGTISYSGVDGIYGFVNNGAVNADVKFQRTGLGSPILMATVGTPSWQNVEIDNPNGVSLDLQYGGAPVINGTLTLTNGIFNLSTYTLTLGNSAQIIRSGGTLSKALTFGTSVDVTYAGTLAVTTSFELPSSATVLNNLTINNSGGVTLGANQTVNGTLSIASGTLADGGFTLTAEGNVSNSGTHSGAGKILLSNGSTTHTLSGTGSFGNLEMNDANGASFTGNSTINGTLTLTNGNITTGANTLSISSSGSISRTSGHIIGNLQKNVASGAGITRTFEIGDATNYTPVDITFANVSGAGSLTANTTAGEFASISGSGINTSKSVNRSWNLVNGATVFDTYDAVFNFVGGDVDGGATASNFVVRKYNGSSWSALTTGTKTSTSTQATGLSSFSDFAIGEQAIDHYSVSAASPQTAGTAFTTTVIAQDILNATVSADNSTVVTMGGTGSVQFDSDGNTTFGDNTKTLTSGEFTISTKDNVAETINITATDGNLKTGTRTAVVVNPGAATQIAVNAGNGQTAVAGTAVATAPSVIVRDVNNNPVSGVSVTFAVATGGGSGTVLEATTNASGIATVGSWTLGTTAGANTLTATSGSLTGSPVTFTATGTAGAASATASTLTPTSASITANGSSTQVLTVTAKDVNGNNVGAGGATVTITQLSGTGTIGTVTDSSNGIYVATVTSPTAAGSGVFVATLGGSEVRSGTGSQTQSTITYSAGAATQIAVNAGNGQTAVAGTAVATAPSVIVRDVNNNPVSGVSVTFAVATGGGSGTVLEATTNASGIATVGSWTLGTTAGANTLTATSGSLTGSPVTFTATGTAGAASATASTLTPTSASITANGSSTQVLTVTAKDVNGNNVGAGGATVTITQLSGTGTISTVTDSSNGIYVATVTSPTAAGSGVFVATLGGSEVRSGTGSQTQSTITYSAGAATQIAVNAGNGQTAVAGTAVATAPSVIVRDVNNNPVSGVSVTFAVATGGGSGTVLEATTNASGIATVGSWTLGTTAGANTLTATSGSLTGSPVTFTATGTAGAASATASTLTPTSASITANGSSTQVLTVTAKDVNGNNVGAGGATVTITQLSGTGTISTVTDSSNGIYVATVTSPTAAGSGVFVATLGGSEVRSGTGSQTQSTITYSAGAATQIAVNAGNGQTAVAGTAVATAPSVIVRDVNNNPVSGVSVTFAVATGGGSGTVLEATTNASGIATVGSWTLGTTAGANTLTATSGSLTGSPVTFTATGTAGAASATASTLTPTSASITANGSSTQVLTVTAKDVNGNNVGAGGATVTITQLSGTGTISTVTDSSNGIYVATVTSPTAAGSGVFVATLGGSEVRSGTGSQTQSTITYSAGAATQIAVNAGNGQTAVAGTAVATAPSVIVRDVNNNPVSGVSVTFAVATGGGSGTVLEATTNASGIATVGSWTLGTTAGANTLTATSGSLTGSPVTFTATGTAGAASATASTLTPTSASITANGSSTQVLTVTAKDVNGNNVGAGGATVTITQLSGTGTISTVTDSSNGIYVATVTSPTAAGSGVFVATLGGSEVRSGTGSQTQSTITYSAGAATQIAVNAGNGQTAVAGTAVATAPSVIVRDVNNNPVSGVSVTFAVATGGGSGTVLEATTNASGIATVGSWTLGTTAGANTLTATSGSLTGSPVTFTATGTAGAASATASTLTPTSASITANGSSTQVLTVTAKDVNGNNVGAGGATVTITQLSGTGTISTVTDSSNGIYVATVTSPTAAGSGVFVATLGGSEVRSGTGSQTQSTITYSAGAATQIAVNAGNGQTAVAGTAVATAPSVIVRDVNNNPVSGVSVTFAVATGGGSGTVLEATTNASGIATVGSWTLGTTAGANTLTATSGSLTGSPVTFTATGTAGAASATASTLTPTSASITANGSSTQVLTVTAKDVNGNNVGAGGATVTITQLSGTGTISTVTDSSNGIYVATVTSPTAAGSGVFVATLGGSEVRSGTGSQTQSTITYSAGAATQIAVNAGNGQTAVAGTAVATAPSVIVRDVNNNPVSGVSVTFAVATGGGSGTVLEATTNASGIATVGSWTLGTTAGANTLTATSGSLTGSPVTFTATGTAGAASATASTLTPTSASITANGSSTQVLTVTAKDVNGNNVGAGGATVTITQLSGTGTISTVTDSSNGIYVATVTSPTAAGSGVFVATLGGSEVRSGTGSQTQSTITYSAGAATQIAVNAGNGQTAVAGTAVATAPSVIVRDVNNNPVSGVSVTFAVATGGGSGTVLEATTNASGIATVGSWTLGTTAGANTLTATSGSLTGSPVTFTATGTAGAASATASTLTPTSASITANGSSTQVLTVTAKDVNGNNVGAGGATVTITQLSGTGTISTVTDSSNGIYVATVTSPTAAGSGVFVATLGGSEVRSGTGSQTQSTITYSAGAATQIAVNAGNGQTAVAGTAVATAPSVIVRDVNNNPVSGVSVTFAVATGGGSGTVLEATTNASGIATVGSWTLGTTAGANTLTATSGSLTGSPVTFTATGTAGAASATASTLTPTSASITANGSSTQVLTVTAKDVNGNNVGAGGATVTITQLSGTGTISTVTDSSNGIYVATVTSPTAAGSGVFVATLGGSEVRSGTGSQTQSTITYSAGAATQIAVNAGNGQTAVAGTAVATAPSVIVRDVNNNPVSGVSVTFAVATGGGSGTVLEATTNASGIATVGSWTLGTTAGANTLTATSGSLTGSPVTFTATGTAGAATKVRVETASNGSGSIVGTQSIASGSTLTGYAITRDTNNNFVANVAATWSLINKTGGVADGDLVPAGNGKSAVFTGHIIGTAEIQADSTAMTPTTSGTLTVIAGAPNAAISTLTPASASITAGGSTQVLTVTAKDASGNNVGAGGATVTITRLSGTGSIGSVADVGNGTYTATVTSPALVGSGVFVARIGVDSVKSGGSFAAQSIITYTAGAASKLAFIQQPTDTTIGATITPAITVQLQDQNSNNVAAADSTVIIFLTYGTGVVSGTDTVKTNMSGLATFSGLSIDSSGRKVFTATSTGLTSANCDTFTIRPLRLSLKVFLQGPYNTGTGSMNTTLNSGGYLASHFVSTPIPANAVDSINIEIRNAALTADATIRTFAAAWLMSDGTIRSFNDASKAYAELDAPIGSYYVVVRHRNHLAIMSAALVVYATDSTGYDFTTAQTQAYGTNAMVALVGGSFGMFAGNADGSAAINATDRNLYWRVQNGSSGYLSGDFNLSSTVNATDRNSYWRPNNGTGSQVPN